MEHNHSHHHDVTSTEELVALIRYLIGHNESHTHELVELADSLHDTNQEEAYLGVLEAVKDFTEGNKKLAKALEKIK